MDNNDLMEYAEFIVSSVLDFDCYFNKDYNKEQLEQSVKLIRMQLLPIKFSKRIDALRDEETLKELVGVLGVDDGCFYINDLDTFLEYCENLVNYIKEPLEALETTNNGDKSLREEKPVELCDLETLVCRRCPVCGGHLTSEGMCLNVDCTYKK